MSYVMFLIGAVGLWGGLTLAIINYVRKEKAAGARRAESPDDSGGDDSGTGAA